MSLRTVSWSLLVLVGVLVPLDVKRLTGPR